MQNINQKGSYSCYSTVVRNIMHTYTKKIYNLRVFVRTDKTTVVSKIGGMFFPGCLVTEKAFY